MAEALSLPKSIDPVSARLIGNMQSRGEASIKQDAELQKREDIATKDYQAKNEDFQKQHEDVTKQENVAIDEVRKLEHSDVGVKEPEPLKQPDFKPEPIDHNQIQALGAIMSVFALIGGRHTSTPMIAAGNALAGAMNGYMEGNKIKFDEDYKTYQTNFNKAVAEHKDQTDSYVRALNNKQNNISSAMREVEIIAKQHGNIKMAEAAATQNYQAVIKEITNERTHNEKIVAQGDKVDIEKIRVFQAAEAKQQAEKDRMQIANIAHQDRVAHEQDLNLHYNQENEHWKNQANGKNKLAQLGSQAFLQNVLGKTAKDEKTSSEITNNAQAISRIDELLTKLKDPEVKTGVASKLATLENKARSALGSDGEITDQWLNDNITSTVNSNDKTAVFQKEALFAAFEAERAAQGGRLTVQMMKQAGSVLDPSNYTKEAYTGVIGSRRKFLESNLRAKGLTNEDILKLDDEFSKTEVPYGGGEATTQTTPNSTLPAGFKPL